MMHNGSGISQFAQKSDQNKHFVIFLFILPSWKIVIFSGSSLYMVEGHFFHLVYHLPRGFEHIFHLVVTFVRFCPYRFETHFSKRSLEITLPLLTKPISQPPEDEFREVKKIFQSASELNAETVIQFQCLSDFVIWACCSKSYWCPFNFELLSGTGCGAIWLGSFLFRARRLVADCGTNSIICTEVQ